MHPLIIQQLAAEHIGEMHAKAANDRLGHQARQARRQRPATPARDAERWTIATDLRVAELNSGVVNRNEFASTVSRAVRCSWAGPA
jgi:hypothetical protein